MLTFVLLLALASPSLESLVQVLKSAPAWQADFTQVFLPAGFSSGTEENGVLTFAYPTRLRFEYTKKPRRIFTVDGLQARFLDTELGTCQAYTLGEGSWAALPLAPLTDPGELEQLFSVQKQGEMTVLVPRKTRPEVARVELFWGRDQLPQQITVVDASGNLNRFTFARWRVVKKIPVGLFAPTLAGAPPCEAQRVQPSP